MSDKNMVIVLSEDGMSGLGAVRALGQAGYTADLITNASNKVLSKAAGSSRYINEYKRFKKRKTLRADIDKVMEKLLSYEDTYDYKPLLFPADSYASALIDDNRDFLCEIFEIPFITTDMEKNLSDYLDFDFQKKLAESCGFSTFNEVVITGENPEYNSDKINYPCKCFALNRFSHEIKEIATVNDKSELDYTVNKIAQNFNGDTVIRDNVLRTEKVVVSGICTDEGIFIPGVLYGDDSFENGKYRFRSDKSTENLEQQTAEMIEKLNYAGPFEVIFNYLNDELYFECINFAGGEALYAGFLCGNNAAAILADSLLFEDVRKELITEGENNKSFANEAELFELYADGKITREQMEECISESDFLYVKNSSDTEPEQMLGNLIEKTQPSSEIEIPVEDRTEQIVVVLSRNYATGLSVIRSLGAAGYKVDLVANAYKKGKSAIAGCSKYVNHYVEIVSKKINGAGDFKIIDELLRYKGLYDHKPVLFPTDDYTASVMDMNRNVLDSIFIMPCIAGGTEGTMTNRMDKTVQGEFARKAGLLTPEEWIIDLSGEIHIPEDVVYPCFCKPIESITGYKKEMAMCNDKVALSFHLKKLKNNFSDRSVLVQEFLDIENEIDFSGVALDQEIIIPAIIRKTNVAQYEKGVTLSGKVVPFDEISEIKENIIEMLKMFHYEGMFDMEFNIVNGKLYFNEVNLRSGGPNFAYFMSGVNLPALYVNEATGKGHTEEDEKVTEFGKSFIYEKIAWEDHINGFMTKKELDKCINDSDIRLLLNEDDPAPGELFTEEIKNVAKRKKLRKLKDKVKSVLRKIKWKIVVPPLRKIKHIFLRYPQLKPSNRRNPDAEKPRVLLSGRNYCSNLCMARSLGEAGYDVEVLRIFQVRPKLKYVLRRIQPDAYSKYVKAFYICVSKRKSRRIVKRLISLADRERKMLLIPTDDLVANIIDENLDILEEFYYMPHIDHTPSAVSYLMNKDNQKQVAAEAGLPVLNSCIIKTEAGQFEIPDSVNYPCFIKPNVSMKSSKSRMKKCVDRDDLYKTLKLFSRKKDIEMLVEDYVEIDREYSLLGLSTPDGVVAPGYFGAEEGGHDAHRGVAMTGKILPVSEEQELIDKIIAFVEKTRFTGLFDVDLIKTTEGRMYFVELNLRFGASGFAFTKCGANLPGMFADYMLMNKPIDKDCHIDRPGRIFLSEKVMLDEYVESFCTRKDMKNVMDRVDIRFIQDDNDPRPYRHFRKFYPLAAIVRKVRSKKNNR